MKNPAGKTGRCVESNKLAIGVGKINDIFAGSGITESIPTRGNTDGLARLAVGQDAREVMNRLRGVQCRGGTSCPDQLSRAIEIYLDQQQHK